MSDDNEVARLREALAVALRLAERANAKAERAAELAARRGRLIDGAMTVADAMQVYARVLFDAAPEAPNCVEWDGTINRRPFALSIQWLDGKSPQTLLAEAMAARDAAEMARFDAAHKAEEWEESHGIEKRRADELTAAVRHEHATRAAWLATLPACASAPADVVAAEQATAAVLAAWEGTGR